MARNGEDRQETVDDSGELIQQDGKWYKQISREEATRIHCDVQLYRANNHDPSYIYRIAPPSVQRAVWTNEPDWWWRCKWFVEVEPNKEEYTCPA